MYKVEGTSQTYGQMVTIEPSTSTGEANPDSLDSSMDDFDLGGDLLYGGGFVEVVEDASAGNTSPQTTIALAASNLNTQTAVIVPEGTISGTPTKSGFASIAGSSVKTGPEINAVLQEAYKLDYLTSLRSAESDSIDFNNMKIPKLQAKFVYNRFVKKEKDITTEEDPSKDPLKKNSPSDVPRYVELKWNIVGVTNPVKGTAKTQKDNETIRWAAFADKMGTFSAQSSNTPYSVSAQKANSNPLIEDGVQKSLVDLHETEQGFDSLANNTEFANSISVGINTEVQTEVISEIPVETITKTQ